MESLYFVVPVLLLAVGFPIYLILLVTALVVVLFVQKIEPTVVQTMMFGSLDSPPMLAIPFFILAGEIMGQGGIAKRLVDWVLAIIGCLRGSLPLTTIASSELFGAMSGSSVGCVAAIGRLMYPSLRRSGYNDRFSVGLIAASGAVAIVIPPSIAMIIYGITASVSVPALFLAGFIPGILIGVIDALYVVYYARKTQAPVRISVTERFRLIGRTTVNALGSLGAPVVIFGGIYGGVFTPTEAAGVAVVYSALVSRYVYGDVSWRDLWKITRGSAYLIAQILIIVAAAGVYSSLLTTSGMPQSLVKYIETLQLDAWTTLLVFNVILLLVGSFLEPPAAILILTPLALPIVKALGIDEVHFGIVVTVNLSIGMYMPPFGLNLFAAHAIFGVPMSTIFRGVIPFLLLNIFALMLITYIPGISLLLSRL
ncbi:MAG: TRAP transporter large permease [Alphaproteobacteria bacterium]